MGLEFYDFEGCVVVFELEIGLIRIETAEQFAVLGTVLKGLRHGRKLLHSLSQFLITYILLSISLHMESAKMPKLRTEICVYGSNG